MPTVDEVTMATWRLWEASESLLRLVAAPGEATWRDGGGYGGRSGKPRVASATATAKVLYCPRFPGIKKRVLYCTFSQYCTRSVSRCLVPTPGWWLSLKQKDPCRPSLVSEIARAPVLPVNYGQHATHTLFSAKPRHHMPTTSESIRYID